MFCKVIRSAYKKYLNLAANLSHYSILSRANKQYIVSTHICQVYCSLTPPKTLKGTSKRKKTHVKQCIKIAG